MRFVTANEANRSFSRLLSAAENGETVVIIRQGKPVAVFGPCTADHARKHEQAVERAIELMRRGLPLGGRRFTRDEMHER